MFHLRFNRLIARAAVIALALSFLSALTVSAQDAPRNLRVTNVSSSSIRVAWDAVPGVREYNVHIRMVGHSDRWLGATDGTSYTAKGLRSNTDYRLRVEADRGSASVSAITRRKLLRFTNVPPVTCPRLPASVVVTGYGENTQCQMVDAAGIGQMDVIERGVIDAVDIWNIVPEDVQVCFQGSGWPVFLDADYSPRMVMEMEHVHRDGMTCGTIDRPGTVALLASAAAASAPDTHLTAAPAEATLPIFEAFPLDNCLIKLVETLFLRAEPGGEIIDIVWLNTEVTAFEINGYWYQVEFEGQIGYISRYYRKVIRGGCG